MSQNSLVTAVIVLVVIVRFLIRELRERHLSQTQLFVLPAIVWALALAFAVGIAYAEPGRTGELVVESAIAVVVGSLIGSLVAHFTTVRTASDGRIFFRGSYVTVAIWVAALLLRLLARTVLARSPAHAGADVANVALVILVAAALTAMRVLVRRKAVEEARRGSSLPETAI